MRASTALSLVLLLAACAAVDLRAPKELLGCWSSSEVETYREDGTRSMVHGECSRFYAERQVFITCVGPNASQLSTIDFEYKLNSPTSYAQNMIVSSHAADVATYIKPHEFQVTEGTTD